GPRAVRGDRGAADRRGGVRAGGSQREGGQRGGAEQSAFDGVGGAGAVRDTERGHVDSSFGVERAGSLSKAVRNCRTVATAVIDMRQPLALLIEHRLC